MCLRAGLLMLALAAGCGGPAPARYEGRYALGPDMVLVVADGPGGLTLLPSFWRTAQILDPAGTDSFVSLLHREIAFAFDRDPAGHAIAVTVTGHREIGGRAVRLDDSVHRPVELLLGGEPEAALTALERDGGLVSPDRAAELGFAMIQNFPSRAGVGARFLERAAERVAPNADLYWAMALGWMLDGQRARATDTFRKALVLAPSSALAIRALRHLDPAAVSPAPDSAWQVPFGLDALFATPTPAEILTVDSMWRARDLAPRAVEELARLEHTVPASVGGGKAVRYEVRMVAHDVHGDRHVGAILVPVNAAPGCCGVVVALHGIDAGYGGADVEGADILATLGRAGERTVIVMPAFRGEELRIGGAGYQSTGTPRDGWDGATDDAIALLNVALASTPAIDSGRICSFGHSRGGTVALLMAIRDSRVSCVVDWAGPADWFSGMGTFGFTLREQVEWALWEHWTPGRGWGSASQFVDWYLADTIGGDGPGLAAIRLRILASSPLHFLERLPAAQLHYGADDRSVPQGNADALRKGLAAAGRRGSAEVFVYPGSGHDQPYPEAYRRSGRFLADALRQR